MTKRNPYVLLGIPFGASRDEANVAFARKARPLRRLGAAGRDDMTDLTWALNQIDEIIRNPDEALQIYRIPADPTAFAPSGPGEFAPLPRPLARTGADSANAVDELQRASTREYLRHLLLLQAEQISIPSP
jgi:hypothetical protein